MQTAASCSGILPICKPKGITSFHLVAILRRLTQVRTIGHAGTLDPFATGVVILLIGKEYTKKSNLFLNQNKEYTAEVRLGIETDSYDIDGQITAESGLIPTQVQIEEALLDFQGTTLQIPPMFSAKKIEGKKLYELARKGITVERAAVPVTMHIAISKYEYPFLEIQIACSKGTYIRSLAHDLGKKLGCGAHLSGLIRTKSGTFSLDDCCDGAQLNNSSYDWRKYLQCT